MLSAIVQIFFLRLLCDSFVKIFKQNLLESGDFYRCYITRGKRAFTDKKNITICNDNFYCLFAHPNVICFLIYIFSSFVLLNSHWNWNHTSYFRAFASCTASYENCIKWAQRACPHFVRAINVLSHKLNNHKYNLDAQCNDVTSYHAFNLEFGEKWKTELIITHL